MFTENSIIGKNLMRTLECALREIEEKLHITYGRSVYLISKDLLKDVVGFVPEAEKKRSSLKPWDTK